MRLEYSLKSAFFSAGTHRGIFTKMAWEMVD